MERDFSESHTFTIRNWKVIRDWRCGVRRVRVFTPRGMLMTKEQIMNQSPYRVQAEYSRQKHSL